MIRSKTLNPRLIYACSRGYGESGPYAAYGNTAQSNNSMTGWTHTSWGYSGAPGTKSLGIGDEAAGVSMALGILAALHARERTGEGQKIVVSMQEAVLGFMISSMHEYFTGIGVGNQPIQVADGFFTLRVPEISDGVWVQACSSDGPRRTRRRSPFCDRGGAPATPSRAGGNNQSMGAGQDSPGIMGRPARPRLLRRACPCRLARCSKIRTLKHGKHSFSAIIRLPGRRHCWRHGFTCPRRPPASATMRRPSANTRTRCSVVFWA